MIGQFSFVSLRILDAEIHRKKGLYRPTPIFVEMFKSVLSKMFSILLELLVYHILTVIEIFRFTLPIKEHSRVRQM